jgi:type VI secretion system secreted protein Hcp
MSEHGEVHGASRRDVLKTGAFGVGALATAMGIGGLAASSADAVAPASATGDGAVDYFLKLDGVPGDSTDSKHKGEIVLYAFSWGVHAPAGASGGNGGGVGKPTPVDFSFITPTGIASPKMFLACAAGTHIATGLLTVRKPGDRSIEYIKLKLTNVLLSSFVTTGDDAAPVDQVSMSFQQLDYSVYPQKADGSAGPAVTATWNFLKNSNS